MIKVIKFLVLFLLTLIGYSCTDNKREEMIVKKRNPGHYVAVGPHFDLSTLKYLDEPAIVGVNKRYNWRDLEPEKDVYDFSSIKNDLEYLASHNKQLVVFFIDRSFWIKGAMPSYLSKYELEADGYGYTNLRWYPEVMERLIKICTEIGRNFDANRNFEGIALQESSLDLKQSDYEKYHYSAVKYRNSIIYILRNLSKGLPESNIFWYGNFIPKDWNGTNIRKVLDNVKNLDISYGVPDILPFHKGYNQSTYKIFEEYKNKVVLFACAQDDSYRHHKNDISHEDEEPLHEEGYLTMEEIFLFGRDHLHLKYIFWNYFYEEAKGGQRTFDDAIDVIHTNPTFNP